MKRIQNTNTPSPAMIIIIIKPAANMNKEITTYCSFTGEHSGSFEYCEENITPQWPMFATALSNASVSISENVVHRC